MKNNKISQLIKASIIKLIDNTTSEIKIKKIIDKHIEKTHFIPIRYRIFGGLLQSLNIQFGNFIEVLIHNIVEKEKNLQIITNISGEKNVTLSLTQKCDILIDRFISDRQVYNDNDLSFQFNDLLEKIVSYQKINDDIKTTKHDVDLLFKNKQTGVIYYIEVKYNDDHDTGKFVDINRKFIKTYAGLIKKLNVKNTSQLKPILYYFNKKIMKGNIYVPEKTHIYRGDKLFKEFFSIKYQELDDYLKNVSEDKEIITIFDDLYKKIRFNQLKEV
jgi:hypothetical protein